MNDKSLSKQQKQTIERLLSQAIRNKQNPHPADLARAAVILYDVNRLGYTLVDYEVKEILSMSKVPYSDTMIEWLSYMANAYADLLLGLNDPQYSSYRVNESDLGN